MELLLLLALLVCAAFWWNIRMFQKMKKEKLPDQEAELLLLEARSVTADFLECGELVRLLSREKYLGTISVRAHSRAGGRIGYTICMYDTGDVRQAFAEFQGEFPEETFPELKQFVDTYGGCYDAQRDALVYTTGHSAGLKGAGRAKLERELYLKIAAHPLAEMEDLSLIRTKNMES